MANPKIIVFYKPMCAWSQTVFEVLEKYQLDYERKNVLEDQDSFSEMIERTNQRQAPCVEINDQMLIDVGGEEVEAFLIQSGWVKPANPPSVAKTRSG